MGYEVEKTVALRFSRGPVSHNLRIAQVILSPPQVGAELG